MVRPDLFGRPLPVARQLLFGRVGWIFGVAFVRK
jgi:hypothetical protein